MQLMTDQAEESIRLLTQLAGGDVALVRQVLVDHKGENAKVIVKAIREAIRKKPAPLPSASPN
jgi:hypothetical protein